MIVYNYYIIIVIKSNAILMTTHNYKIENSHDIVISKNRI